MLNLALALFFLLTSSAPSDINGPPTSKSFTGVVSFLGDGETLCVEVTTTNECTAAELNALDEDGTGYAIGKCGDEFKKTCDVEVLKSGGRKTTWPHTVSAEHSKACGETVFTVLMEDCSVCDNLESLITLNSENEVVSGPTCEDVEPGFFTDFINKVKGGEALYIGILVALVAVPVIICLLICCCCMMAQPQGVTTYKIRSAV